MFRRVAAGLEAAFTHELRALRTEGDDWLNCRITLEGGVEARIATLTVRSRAGVPTPAARTHT